MAFLIEVLFEFLAYFRFKLGSYVHKMGSVFLTISGPNPWE